MVWSAKKWYEGSWKNNTFDGMGKFVLEDALFFGSFVNDKKNGIGMFFQKNGSCVVSFYKNNKIDVERCCLKIKNGKEKFGKIRNGKFEEFMEDNKDKKELEKFSDEHFEKLSEEYKKVCLF